MTQKKSVGGIWRDVELFCNLTVVVCIPNRNVLQQREGVYCIEMKSLI